MDESEVRDLMDLIDELKHELAKEDAAVEAVEDKMKEMGFESIEEAREELIKKDKELERLRNKYRERKRKWRNKWMKKLKRSKN